MKKLLLILSFALALLPTIAKAQVYTFECVSSPAMTGDSCEGCPVWLIESRSFDGLVIWEDGLFWRWIEIPYTLKVRNDTLDIWEHTSPPSRLGKNLFFPDRVSIRLAQTTYSTMEGFVHSVWCNRADNNEPLWYATDSIDIAPVYRGDTVSIVGRGIIDVDFDSLLQKFVITADTTGLGGGGGGSGVTSIGYVAPAAGVTISGTNPVTSTGTWTFALADDLAALEGLGTTGIGVRTGTSTWTTRTITAGTGSITVGNGDGVSGNPTINNTDPDQSATNELQTYGHAGTSTYTNTLSLGGGSWSITGAGIAVISNIAGAITVTANEIDGSITNELQTYAHTGTTNYTNTLSSGGGAFTLNASTGITISHAAGVVTISSSITQYTDEQAQDAVGNILTDGAIIDFTYNDAGNTITATVINNSIGNAQLRQGNARSVVGVTGNAIANVADIQGTTDQVLRVNTAGTALAFGQVATGGITDDAVTYAKIQNVAANNVLLGNIAGAGTAIQELTVAQTQTLLGYIDGTGVVNRIAWWSDPNTLTNDLAFVVDGTNDRMTLSCTTPAQGAGVAILNILNLGTDTDGDFLRMDGNMSGNLTAGQYNVNTGATANTIYTISTGGNAAGDPILQFQVAGGGGTTSAIGIDNTDVNKLKISPNTPTPGGIVNTGITLTNDAVTLVGINKDAPIEELDVAGEVRARHFLNTGNLWNNGLCTFGTGAGTGPTINGLTGGNNFYMFEFTTGTAPVANQRIAILTFPNAYPVGPTVSVFTARNTLTATDIAKFYVSSSSDTALDIWANGTLTAGTQYKLMIITGGRE